MLGESAGPWGLALWRWGGRGAVGDLVCEAVGPRTPGYVDEVQGKEDTKPSRARLCSILDGVLRVECKRTNHILAYHDGLKRALALKANDVDLRIALDFC